MYRCENIMKAECKELILSNCDAGEDSWKSLGQQYWTARRSNESILKESIPEYSSEGLMLKLKPQYFGRLMRRADSLAKPPMLGKTEGRIRRSNRGWNSWVASLTQWTWVCANSVRQWRMRKSAAAKLELQSQSWLSNRATTDKEELQGREISRNRKEPVHRQWFLREWLKVTECG